jgi:hypothetical protein
MRLRLGVGVVPPTPTSVEIALSDEQRSVLEAWIRWRTRSMVEQAGVTADAVLRIWHAFGLQPRRQPTWKLSNDPQFIEKVHDICGLYLNPPERAVVLAVDEKSQIQAMDRTAPTLPMLPGTPERAIHDDERNGTTSLYAILRRGAHRSVRQINTEIRRWSVRMDQDRRADSSSTSHNPSITRRQAARWDQSSIRNCGCTAATVCASSTRR